MLKAFWGNSKTTGGAHDSRTENCILIVTQYLLLFSYSVDERHYKRMEPANWCKCPCSCRQRPFLVPVRGDSMLCHKGLVKGSGVSECSGKMKSQIHLWQRSIDVLKYEAHRAFCQPAKASHPAFSWEYPCINYLWDELLVSYIILCYQFWNIES